MENVASTQVYRLSDMIDNEDIATDGIIAMLRDIHDTVQILEMRHARLDNAHTCRRIVTTLHTYNRQSGPGSSQSRCLCKCIICGRYWVVRYQFDAGTGSDDVWTLVPDDEIYQRLKEIQGEEYE